MQGKTNRKVKQILDDEQQKKYLLSKIDGNVHFKYPNGEDPESGTLVDRYALKLSDVPNSSSKDIIYWMVMDMIEFQGQAERQIRMSYYRYKKSTSRWIFAGQTSFSFPISEIIQYFTGAVKEKEWFKKIFQEILKRCVNEFD